MNNFFIYKFDYKEVVGEQTEALSATVIFCDRVTIQEDDLSEEIRNFYNANYQTDEIFVIAGDYIAKDKLEEIFIKNIDKTFIGIPRRHDTFLKDNLHVLTFDKVGRLRQIFGEKEVKKGFFKFFLNEGLQNIFINRGGLVTSQGSHHFVFPSGKHCDKFLRTGNVLLISSEIYFIAYALLKHLDENIHNKIYCDTSSINSVAFALVELKNRFLKNRIRRQLPIESFSSYEGLYKNELSYNKNSLLIISASTSSNIISYILDRHKEIDRCNMVIMFFLGEKANYSNIKDKVMCNLTLNNDNPNGIPLYQVSKADDCEHCKKGSYPVDITGDIFTLEKPKINRIILKVTDADKNLSEFVNQFKSVERKNSVFKTHYKENSQKKYEIYIDYNEILKGISGEPARFAKYKIKLNDYINQYIPSNTKYLISLKDESSINLRDYIYGKISDNYKVPPKKLGFEDLKDVKDIPGTIVVVGSCISNGKALLYLSRALRKHTSLRIIYFVGITRTKTKTHSEFLKANLKQGPYGTETSSYIEVESIFCDNNCQTSSWINEGKFLTDFLEFVLDNEPENTYVHDFIRERIKFLDNASGNEEQGLFEQLFFPIMTSETPSHLEIRNGFVFFKFTKYHDHVTQADVFFTISKVLNDFRNSSDLSRSLKQTVFVRNMIDPGNFNRFNDGIIQASILRSARADEMNYAIDPDLSTEMTNILETIIKYHHDQQGEALVEFLYSIAIKKLSLRKEDLKHLIIIAKDMCNEPLILSFVEYIDEKIVNIEQAKKLEPYDCRK